MVPADRWSDQLRLLVADRQVILVAPTATGAAATVGWLVRLGAASVLVVCGRRSGTELEEATVVELGLQSTSLLEVIRSLHRAVSSPPERVRAAVEAFDPERRALVLGDAFNTSTDLLGRPFLAHRRAQWVALEDKTVIDAFWDRAGVRREPSTVVALDLDALTAARWTLDHGHGVVVAADATSGWHGGAAYVRHVPVDAPVDEISSMIDEFRAVAETARVMPFVPGLPSSIHGIVLADDVVVLRPVEMVVLHRPDGRFFYAGSATFHDPTAAERDVMRDVARRVGRTLRDEVGFLGAFTVDGILGPEGFRPTELNPRVGAGMRPLTQAIDLPLPLLLDAAAAGSPFDWSPVELEGLLLDAADRHRAGATYREFSFELPEEHGELVLADGRFRRSAVGEPGDLRYELRPGGFGTIIRGFPAAGERLTGRSFAPVAAAFWRWADQEYGLSIGPVEPAADLGDLSPR